MNRNGFTFLMAIFMVMIIGIMLGLTGQFWKTIMKREREKELIFRGSQIKEAIENWYNPKYIPGGGAGTKKVNALLDLKDLLGGNLSEKRFYLPHSYAAELDDKNPKCAPDCAKIKIYQDPMTGKEWTIIRGTFINNQCNATNTESQGACISGVASKSEEEPLKKDFKDTAFETTFSNSSSSKKYSKWKFIADPNNDHKKIYKAYHESW